MELDQMTGTPAAITAAKARYGKVDHGPAGKTGDDRAFKAIGEGDDMNTARCMG